MKLDTLVADAGALAVLDSALIEDGWFENFFLPDDGGPLRRVVVGRTVYLLSRDASFESGLLVALLGESGLFGSDASPRSIFERVVRVALRYFDRSIAIPVQWQAYHEGALVSVFAESFVRKSRYRVHFDQAPRLSHNIYAYALTDGPAVLRQVPEDLDAYDRAVAGYEEALVADPPTKRSVGNFGILLSSPLGVQLAGAGTLSEWYDHRLNEAQRKFVNQGLDRPIRLRGAAGTGKTQAMAVKCLRDLYLNADAGGDLTVAFLTHSSALAHEVVRGMFYALDPSDRWQDLTASGGRSRLWIGTLYELAQEKLGYEKKGLRPLSLDGRDGRELQRLLINDAVHAVETDERIALGMWGQSEVVASRLGSTQSRPFMVEEIMNEFACVLDAENIRKGTPEAERYVQAVREAWQMVLPTQYDRKLMLEIHDAYKQLLRKERLLSLDQMIADFDRYLSTHEWNQLRDTEGFDLIFVDEYHYFTRLEAMTLQNLFASRAGQTGRWPLIMAYDLKQSPSDAAFGGGVQRFRNPGVGESVPVELKQVFRSTPQIAAFLSDLDASFPAMDLEGEYETYGGHSSNEDGLVPILLEFDTDINLIDSILDMAVDFARKLPAGGSDVAVLCLNEDVFDRSRRAGRTQSKMVAVTSREDLKELRYAKTRCVFSMPEYVAGLQFSVVILAHVDAADLSDEYLSQGARRRYVSRAYLGASRARYNLLVASSAERGGPSEILSGPLRTGSLTRTLP